MEGTINYILTLTYDGKPTVVVESDLEQLLGILLDGPKHGVVFGMIDAQRMVVSAGGMVTYSRVYPTWDGTGIIIMDKYNTIIDSYYKPEAKKKKHTFLFRRVEVWANETTVEADSESEACEIVDKMVEDGEFDVLDGWCVETQSYAERIGKES